jgi:transcriptional regulator with XRE-family HTH domain
MTIKPLTMSTSNRESLIMRFLAVAEAREPYGSAMENNIQIANWKEVSRRLVEARHAHGLSAREVAELMGSKQANVARWESGRETGKEEGAVTDIARMGAVLGIEPNQLLLETPAEDKPEARRLRLQLNRMGQLIGNDQIPFGRLADFVSSICDEFSAPPIGTTIDKRHPGTRGYVPPAVDVARKMRDRAGEPAADYGKKKRKS